MPPKLGSKIKVYRLAIRYLTYKTSLFSSASALSLDGLLIAVVESLHENKYVDLFNRRRDWSSNVSVYNDNRWVRA